MFLERTRLFPGIKDALVALAADYDLAVATSKPARFTEPLLAELEIEHLFRFVASPAPNVLEEPKAATVGKVLGALGHSSAVMVGDRSLDIVGARAHGLPTVGVTWGSGTREELEAFRAVAVIDQPSELAATVRSVFSKARNNASDGDS